MGIIWILVAVALLVWSVVGIMTIVFYVYYHRLMKPMIKPMTKMYQDLYKEINEEA